MHHLVLLSGLGLLVLAACGTDAPKGDYRFVQFAEVEGACTDDQTRRSVPYSGSVVHWRHARDGTELRYGSVTHWAFDTDRIPGDSYLPPSTVRLDDLPAEALKGDRFTTRGSAERPTTGDTRLDTTCELRVTRRSDRLPAGWTDAR